MTIKNASQDFQLKKEFIDIQLELKKFLEETDVFTLKDILKDSLIVHSLNNFIDAYKEAEEIKHIKKVLRKLLKLKKKNINIGEILKNLEPSCAKSHPAPKITFPEMDFKDSYFRLNQVKQPLAPQRDKILHRFKNHMKRLEYYKKINIKAPVISRNYSSSSSHSHLIKKIEKSPDFIPVTPTPGKINNEITTNMSFRNGIQRTVPSGERNIKSSGPSPVTQQAIRANRSPKQASINQNPNQINDNLKNSQDAGTDQKTNNNQ